MMMVIVGENCTTGGSDAACVSAMIEVSAARKRSTTSWHRLASSAVGGVLLG